MDVEGDTNLFRRIQNERIGLFIGTGVMRGIDGGSRVAVLNERSVEFTKIWASSSGAPAACYYATKQASLGVTIYIEECCTEAFLSLTARRLIIGNALDAAYLTRRVFVGGPKALDMSAFASFRMRGNIRLGVTRYRDGEGVWLDSHACVEGPLMALEATMAVPGLYRTPVEIGGERMIDGALGCPFPDEYIIDSCDGWVIFANTPRSGKKIWRDWVVSCIIGVSLPRGTKYALLHRYALYERRLAYLRTSGKPYCILWSDPSVEPFTRDSLVLERARKRATEHMHRILDSVGV